MAAPATIAETYVGCTGTILTIGTAPDVATPTVMEGGYTDSKEVVERTNNKSGGCYEDLATIRKIEGDITIAFKTSENFIPVSGGIYHCIFDCPDGPYLEANFRFPSVGKPVLDVKNGLICKTHVTMQGPPITETRPGP